MVAFDESWAGEGVEAILAADAARHNNAMDLISMRETFFLRQPFGQHAAKLEVHRLEEKFHDVSYGVTPFAMS